MCVCVTRSHLRSKEPPGLQLGSDYIDVDAKIDCGDRLIRMHNLDFAMKTTQTESILLSSSSYELKNVRLR